MLRHYKNQQYYKFCLYGFFKNLQLFEPFLMLFFIEKGISFIQIGALYAIREITILILEIPTGIFADIMGRRKTMVASFLGYILSFILFFFSTNYLFLIIAMLFFSFGSALRTGTHKAIIFDYLKIKGWESQKLNYYGRTRSWSQIGSAISSIFAALVVIYFESYKWVFIFSTLPYIVDLALVLSYPKTLDGPIKSISNQTLKIRFNTHYKAIKNSLNNLNIWYTLTNLSIFQGYFKSIKDYLQPLIIIAFTGTYLLNQNTSKDYHTITIGVTYFFIFLLASTTSRNVHKITRIFKTEKLTLNTTLYFGLGLGILIGTLLYSNINSVAILFFIIIYILQNIRKPYGATLIANKVKNETMATSLSIQSQLDSIFTAIFALLLGFLANNYPLGKAILYFGVCLMGLSILFELSATILPKKHSKSFY